MKSDWNIKLKYHYYLINTRWYHWYKAITVVVFIKNNISLIRISKVVSWSMWKLLGSATTSLFNTFFNKSKGEKNNFKFYQDGKLENLKGTKLKTL